MRLLFLLLSAVCFLAPASAQQITGKIVDTKGKPIEYVNVGVANTTVGVISDNRGRFSIQIPDSLNHSEVIFSHVSYDPLQVPVADLRRITLPGGDREIRLSERSVLMPHVTVIPAKARYKRIGSSHLTALRNARFVALPRRHAIDPEELTVAGMDTLSGSEFNGEFLTKLEIRRPMLIREVSFPILRLTHDCVLFRLNFYEQREGVFIPIHRKPVYILVNSTTEPLYHDVDILDEEIVVAAGQLYVGLELVRYFGFRKEGVMELPFHPGQGYRRAGIDRFEPMPGQAGVQVYGLLLPE